LQTALLELKQIYSFTVSVVRLQETASPWPKLDTVVADEWCCCGDLHDVIISAALRSLRFARDDKT